MSDSVIPFKVSLKDDTGKEIDNTIINAPNSHIFTNLSAGKYTVTCISPEGYTLTTPNPSRYTLTDEEDALKVTIELNDISPPLPVAIIPLAMLSMVLLANCPLVKSPVTPPQEPISSQVKQPSDKSRTRGEDNILPPEVESKLRQCLKKNLKRLLNIPSLSSLIELLNNEEENSKTEFQEQATFLYKKVKELRATIEDCDPTLIQEIIAAEVNQNEQKEPQYTVMVTARMVNVRAGQSLDYEVIEQISYGTILQVDNFVFAKLSQQQLLAIERNEGWYPVILADGRKGYVYSLYARRSS